MMKVTYLEHSGFLVELEDSCLLFDYYRGELPGLDPDKKMLVFVSHAHYDHCGGARFLQGMTESAEIYLGERDLYFLEEGHR